MLSLLRLLVPLAPYPILSQFAHPFCALPVPRSPPLVPYNSYPLNALGTQPHAPANSHAQTIPHIECRRALLDTGCRSRNKVDLRSDPTLCTMHNPTFPATTVINCKLCFLRESASNQRDPQSRSRRRLGLALTF